MWQGCLQYEWTVPRTAEGNSNCELRVHQDWKSPEEGNQILCHRRSTNPLLYIYSLLIQSRQRDLQPESKQQTSTMFPSPKVGRRILKLVLELDVEIFDLRHGRSCKHKCCCELKRCIVRFEHSRDKKGIFVVFFSRRPSEASASKLARMCSSVYFQYGGEGCKNQFSKNAAKFWYFCNCVANERRR